MKTIAIIGGGPAGLRAAEMAGAANTKVIIYEAKASPGRKFLVAGKGGLNLTKIELPDAFRAQYSGPNLPHESWKNILASFTPDDLRDWTAGLGVETIAASTGRVYPREMKAAPLLRRWVQRLRSLGVQFAMHHRWVDLENGARLRLTFETGGGREVIEADAAVLAMGGGSWPETGSNGRWVAALENRGVALSPLGPANCGWDAAWPPGLTEAEGLPLKNITARAGASEAIGELLITRHGLEGGVIYQLGTALRAMEKPRLVVDLKPDVSVDQLMKKLGPVRRNFLKEARQRWRLSEGAFSLLNHLSPAAAHSSAEALAHEVKNFSIFLLRSRPLDEAISSSGGVRWEELDDGLMLNKFPGVFCAGEMIDWEAPTGGYLMQACFATGTVAGRSARCWVESRRPPSPQIRRE